MATTRVQKNATLGLPGYRSRDYVGWAAMIQRCHNPNSSKYPKYGGRGISVCDRWREFKHFYEDMEAKPQGKTLGRIDNDGPYCKDNCRWESHGEQSQNRTTTVFAELDGKRKPLIQWCEELGASYKIVRDRVRLGWSAERALNTPKLFDRDAFLARMKKLGKEPINDAPKVKVEVAK